MERGAVAGWNAETEKIAATGDANILSMDGEKPK
jgi:hypothetical protein